MTFDAIAGHKVNDSTVSTTLSILRKYAQKALCTKIPLTRGVTGKTFTDTEEKKKNNTEQMPPTLDWNCHTATQ